MPLLKGLFVFALLCPVFYHSSLSCSQFLTWSGFLSLGMICCYPLVLAVPFLHLLKTQFLEKHVWRKTYSLVSLLGLLSYLPRTNLLTYVLAQLLNSFCFALPYLGLPCLTLLCPSLIAFSSCWIFTFSPFSHFLRNLYISCSKVIIEKIKVLDFWESFTRAICKIFSLFRFFYLAQTTPLLLRVSPPLAILPVKFCTLSPILRELAHSTGCHLVSFLLFSVLRVLCPDVRCGYCVLGRFCTVIHTVALFYFRPVANSVPESLVAGLPGPCLRICFHVLVQRKIPKMMKPVKASVSKNMIRLKPCLHVCLWLRRNLFVARVSTLQG